MSFQDELNKPRHKIKDLVVGSIGILKRINEIGGECEYHGKIVKKFAICKMYNDGSFAHIKSCQVLSSPEYAKIGDFVLFHKQKFVDKFADAMIECGQTEEDRLSISEIYEIENEANRRLAPNLEVDELFQ